MTEKFSKEAIEARKDYQREWRKANPEKVREYARRHWERVASEKFRNDPEEGGCR